MPTKRYLVGKAFAKIGIGNWEFDLQPDEIQDAVTDLDNMMALWSSEGIRVGYDLTSDDPDTESGLPDVAREAVIMNLALRIAPGFGKQLGPQILSLAASSYSYLAAYFMTIPQRRFPNTLPLGAGNRLTSVAGQVNFFPQGGGGVAVGPDSTLGLNP
jgi:hypothetical protein